jgi:hypothetical protein
VFFNDFIFLFHNLVLFSIQFLCKNLFLLLFFMLFITIFIFNLILILNVTSNFYSLFEVSIFRHSFKLHLKIIDSFNLDLWFLKKYFLPSLSKMNYLNSFFNLISLSKFEIVPSFFIRFFLQFLKFMISLQAFHFLYVLNHFLFFTCLHFNFK